MVLQASDKTTLFELLRKSPANLWINPFIFYEHKMLLGRLQMSTFSGALKEASYVAKKLLVPRASASEPLAHRGSPFLPWPQGCTSIDRYRMWHAWPQTHMQGSTSVHVWSCYICIHLRTYAVSTPLWPKTCNDKASVEQLAGSRIVSKYRSANLRLKACRGSRHFWTPLARRDCGRRGPIDLASEISTTVATHKLSYMRRNQDETVVAQLLCTQLEGLKAKLFSSSPARDLQAWFLPHFDVAAIEQHSTRQNLNHPDSIKMLAHLLPCGNNQELLKHRAI